MTHSKSGRRRLRVGHGLLPPNPKQWDNEHNGLDLREDLTLTLDVELPHMQAFALVPHVTVLPHGAIPVAAKFAEYLRIEGRSNWSGFSLRIDDENELVLFNDAHPVTRVRATLMEEFFHLRLGHQRSVVRVLSTGAARSYDALIEHAAFGSGAAALLPYSALKRLLDEGQSIRTIANRFSVSDELVQYRLKVTRLYRRNRHAVRSRAGS